jgi:hypothetical protein
MDNVSNISTSNKVIDCRNVTAILRDLKFCISKIKTKSILYPENIHKQISNILVVDSDILCLTPSGNLTAAYRNLENIFAAVPIRKYVDTIIYDNDTETYLDSIVNFEKGEQKHYMAFNTPILSNIPWKKARCSVWNEVRYDYKLIHLPTISLNIFQINNICKSQSLQNKYEKLIGKNGIKEIFKIKHFLRNNNFKYG